MSASKKSTSKEVAAAIVIGLSSFAVASPLAGLSMGSLIRNVGAQQCYYPPNAVCTEYMVPMTITSENNIFNFTKWDDDYALQQFLALATTRVGADYPTVIEGTKNVTLDVEIAASFCTPTTPNGKEKNVILATHGIGPGREHWNSEYKPGTYNFVQAAITEGYSVFFYDRLGCGLSTKLSGFESQLSQPVAVLTELAGLLKGGQYTGSVGVPEKLALIGFSFGSYITHNAIAATPDLADSVVLTAIGLNTTVGVNGNGLLRSFEPRVASTVNTERFGELDSGYLTWVDKFGMLLNYFYYPNYESGAVAYNQQKRQAFSIGEFLTFATVGDTSAYAGSILTITAETDYIVCDGFCPGIYKNPAETLYKGAKALVRHLVSGTSHNINFHVSAPDTYAYILKFLDGNL